jgi:CRISPR/Cas system-associated exonuclease Cas4 (RecB family)
MITEITQSLINELAKCPHRVYLGRVKGIKIPPGVAARRGSMVHKGAEHIHRVKADTGADVPMDEATDAARDEFRRLVIEEGVYLDREEQSIKNELLNVALNEGVASVRTYRKHISPAMKDIAIVEERLYADVGAGIPISGQMDVVADGMLTDLKTSAKRWTDGQEDTLIQPAMYRLLLKANGFGPLDARYVILSPMKRGPKETDENIVFDSEEGICCECRYTARTDEQEKKLIARIHAVAGMLKKGDFPPGPPDQWWCSEKFCGYFKTVCKYT